MAIKLANRIGQAGVFYTGSPNYVDVDNAFAVVNGLQTFAVRAADSVQPGGVWAASDTLGVLLVKDATNWQVWYASWDATNEYLLLSVLEDSAGSLSNADAVTVYGTVTAEQMQQFILGPQFVTVSGTTHTTSTNDLGRTLRCTSGSAVTITLDAAAPVPYHGLVIQEGAGLVSFARASTDTLNGGTANVDMAGQWSTAYFYQATEGAWVIVT